MEIIIVRHGQTDWNLFGRKIGKKNIPLNQTGREQAIEIANKLATQKIDFISTSPLSRAHETAFIIKDRLKNTNIIIDPDLTELGLGNLEGLTSTEIEKIFPGFDTYDEKHRSTVRAESILKSTNLWRTKLHKMKSIKDNQTIVLVTHKIRTYSILLALRKDTTPIKQFQNCDIININI